MFEGKARMRNAILPGLIACCCLGLCCVLDGQAADEIGGKRHKKLPWSFRAPVRPPIPQVKQASWVHNPIDAFILARLEEVGLQPSPEVSRRQLIRRVTFDLTGLPPTPEEVDTFVNDSAADAYEKVVDRLLASPRFGERWATYWLDLARFAESDGFKADDPRPTAWRYRDYVIEAFNQDKPYDQFILEQLAGDELYPDNPAAIVATGFNRNFPDEWNAKNLDQRRQEILNDITDVTSQVFLGLTLGCARCHDHKYDPLSQKDYYRFQAFFAAFSPRDNLPLATREQLDEHASRMHEWEARTEPMRQQLQSLEEPIRTKMVKQLERKYQKLFQVAYDTPFAQRTPFQKQIADMFAKQLVVNRDQMVKSMKTGVRKEWDQLNEKMHAFDALKPAPLPVVMGLTDVGSEAPPTHLLIRGNFRKLGEKLQPGFPTRLDSAAANPPSPAPGAATTGRRTVLAKWLASPQNPLTALVMVNRLWQHHFGRGIAANTSDLGVQGESPTHPELLDWLTTEFVARGWSLKAMHRLMVTSSTYRQSSIRNLQGDKADPDNRLLWRMTPRRLEGEFLRDAMLLVSGKINLKMGGPSVFPELPKEIEAPRGWKVTPDRAEQQRRSVYIFVKRNLRYPLFDAFDSPDSNETCARRHVSTNAPQALSLMNGEFTLEMARELASRVLHGTDAGDDNVAERLYRLALGRAPDNREKQLAAEFLQQQIDLLRRRLEDKRPIALPSSVPPGTDLARAGAVVELCHVVLCLNEFLYVD
jgi:hypothetical protein